MKMKSQLFVQWVVCAVLVFVAPGLCTGENMPEPSHKSMVVVDGYFQYHYGAWATYTIHDIAKGEDSIIFFSTLEREEYEGNPAMWMEIAVRAKGQEEVVTRVLLEETAQGPGKPYAVVVQPHGMEPFTVPDSFMEEAEKESQGNTVIQPHGTAKAMKITVGQRVLKGWLVQGEDDTGRPVEAVVSDTLPPLGLVRVKTPDITMKLKNFGSNAQSKIEGVPMNFYLWLTLQIGKGLSGEN